MRIFAVAAAIAAASCSNSDPAPSPCADISGNYSATAERVSGDCDASIDPKGPSSYSIVKSADGWTALVPGIQGGCPGTLDHATCKATFTCQLTDQKSGALIATTSADDTFTATGYTGTSVEGVQPPAVAKTCQVTYRTTGTKL